MDSEYDINITSFHEASEFTTAGSAGQEDWVPQPSMTSTSIFENDQDFFHIDRIWIFVFLLALSGIFSSTFTLTFAYISDTVPNKEDRVSAYGLALATFGLSFTVGPMAGGKSGVFIYFLIHFDHSEL